MKVYSSDSDAVYFGAPYFAKYLLNDSITRTFDGYNSIRKGTVLTGCGNIFLGRIQSAAACAIVVFTAALDMIPFMILTPVFLIPTIALNLGSRLPKISSSQSVQNFTRDSSDVIRRIFKVYSIAIPVILLFSSTSAVNTFIPGVLKQENMFFNAIHKMVEPLGELKTLRASVPGANKTVVGTQEKLSILQAVEEHLRTLSYKNHLKEVKVSYLYHEHTRTRYR